MPYLIEAAVALVLVILQVISSNFIMLLGGVPDLALIFIIWMVLKRGQLAAELAGFGLGLLLDILASGTPGAHSLTYTIVGFLLGYFASAEQSEQRLRNWPFLLFVFLGSVINNSIYFLLFTSGSGLSFTDFIMGRGGLGTLYTTLIAVAPMFYWSRRPLY